MSYQDLFDAQEAAERKAIKQRAAVKKLISGLRAMLNDDTSALCFKLRAINLLRDEDLPS